MDKIKIILFAMTGFGNNAFRVLTKEPFIDLIGVVTPIRHKTPFPYYKCKHLQDVVIDSGIILYEGLILKEKSAYELINSLLPDLIVVSTFYQIIPRSIIAIPRLGIINVHPSLLPKYRGPTPTYWVLENGENETGVTVHFIEDEKVDSGRIVTQLRLNIFPSDTDGTLREKLSELSVEALSKALPLVIKSDKKIFPEQNKTEGSYYPRFCQSIAKDSDYDI